MVEKPLRQNTRASSTGMPIPCIRQIRQIIHVGHVLSNLQEQVVLQTRVMSQMLLLAKVIV